MQTIRHKQGYRNAHWLLDDIERAYADLSDNTIADKKLIPSVYDESLQAIFECFSENTNRKFDQPIFVKNDIEKLKLPKFNPKNIIVCYSGGKDSLVTVRHYQKMGYNVYAYHIKGLNKGYADEWKVAEETAKTYGFTLVIDELSYSGQHIWIEHPLKNMIMANMALTYGIQMGITTKIAVGTFRTAFMVDNSFDVCAGDCIDMWQNYENIVKQFIPNFKIYVPNLNFHTAYRAIVKEPDLLKHTISCLTPNRFRNLFRERTQGNYKIKLLPNRCGCCWKCAAEYIYFCDFGVLELNKAYYIHCIEVLLHTLEQEIGYKVYNVNLVWDKYMMHPIKKSKMYKELQNAVVLSGKVEITTKDIER